METFQHFTKQDNGKSVLFFEDNNIVFRVIIDENNTIEQVSYSIRENNVIYGGV